MMQPKKLPDRSFEASPVQWNPLFMEKCVAMLVPTKGGNELPYIEVSLLVHFMFAVHKATRPFFFNPWP